jgi:hypothetical protein
MRQRLPAIGLALLLAGLLFLIASGAFEETVIVPLLFLWWAAQVLYASLPEALVWGAFVMIAVLVIARSIPWQRSPLPIVEAQTGARGRVANWSRWLRESSRDNHGRWRLAQRLSQLAVEALALREQCSPQEVGRRLEDGSLDLPPDLRAYLRAGLSLYAPRPQLRRLTHRTSATAKGARDRMISMFQRRSRSSRLERRAGTQDHLTPADPLDVDPVLVVEYLEHTLQLSAANHPFDPGWTDDRQ